MRLRVVVTAWELLLLASTWHQSSAVRLQPLPEDEVLSKDTGETEGSVALRAGILWRFLTVDANNDSVVTLDELRNAGLGQLPGEVGEKILRGMLQACTGVLGSENCTIAQMEAALRAWPVQQARREAIGALTGAKSYVDVGHHQNRSWPLGEPCGASAESGGNGDTMCYMQGPKCWNGDFLTAWGLHKVCASRGCLCEPTVATKRFAKLGFAGALAVYSSQDFSDPHDAVESPQCGEHWKVDKVFGRLELRWMSQREKQAIKSAAHWLSPDPHVGKKIAKATTDFTEVAVFSSNSQQLTKRGPANGKVCMVSWQGTRSKADWKTNFMLSEVPFRFVRDVFLPEGVVMAYESTRNQIKTAWERRCCSNSFRANQTVISGHSHGGALAILHAMDMVTNWQCMGKDLGADDIKLVTVAPHKHMLSMEAISSIFSCSDRAKCLAGSVATLITDSDRVGDGRFGDTHGLPVPVGMPFQPSMATVLPCAAKPFGAVFHADDAWWCHAMFNYVRPVEDVLVGLAGWGSTCGGSCGNMNRLVQCQQFVAANNRGCSYARRGDLKTARPCSAWDADKEKCICQFDSCMDLTVFGCQS